MDDSPGPKVRALLGGGALRAGLECYGTGGVGPTRVWYLLWAGAIKEEPLTSTAAVEAAAAAEGRAAGALGPAVAAVAGEVPAAGELGPAAELGLAATSAPGVEVPTGGVGLWRTRGR